MTAPVEYVPSVNLRESLLSRITPPFHEGENIRAFLFALISELERVERLSSTLLDAFTLDNAEGVQLDTLGVVAGLPRTVCNVKQQRFFGLNTPDTPTSDLGMGKGRWYRSTVSRLRDYTFQSDDEYRRFIRVKAASDFFDGTLSHYQRIARHLFDGTPLDDDSEGTTRVTAMGHGRVILRVYRDLTGEEASLIELYKYVLPFYGGYVIRVAAGTDRFQLSCNPSNGTGFGTQFADIY